jgi:nickel/cobalt transporter (NiCoT) family protein
LILMLVLGLRHGLDPDHIAIIDGLTYRSIAERRRSAPWIGTLFALGHGLTVTAIAVALGAMAGSLTLAPREIMVLHWLPVALLILVGAFNLRSLIGPQQYTPVGWKSRLLPGFLRNSAHPFAIFGVGVLFALVFESVTQAAAWGYAAAHHNGAGMALLSGLTFTAGMVVTDTLDGRLMVRLLGSARAPEQLVRYRRRTGWLVVALSFGSALYSIGAHFRPTWEADEHVLGIAGGLLFSSLLAACLWPRKRLPSQP